MRTGNRRIALAALLLLALPLVGAKCPNGNGGGDPAGAEPVTEEGWVPAPAGPRWTAYELREDFVLVHGDMRIELDHLRAFQAELPEENVDVELFGGALVGSRQDLWPDGRVPYDAASIAESFPGTCQGTTTQTCETHLDCSSQGPVLCMQSQVATDIQTAIEEWNTKTDFNLVPATGSDPHVLKFFEKDAADNCHANVVGYWPNDSSTQGIYVDASCSAGTIAHEIGHSVGFWHEHSRADRGPFVEIRSENAYRETCGVNGCTSAISWSDEHNLVDTHGSPWGPYDYNSIMHYSWNGLTQNGQPTIAPKIPMPSWISSRRTVMGQRMALSKGDIAAANALVAWSSGEPMPDEARALFERRGTFPIVPEEMQTADVDGDGTQELVGFMKGSGSGADDGDLVVGWLEADGTFDFEVQEGAHCLGQVASCAFGDVDGVGGDDLVELDNVDNQLRVSLSNGAGFDMPAIWQSVPQAARQSPPAELWLADVDGDCDDDAVIIRHGLEFEAEQVWVALSTRSGFEAAVRFETQDLQMAPLQLTQVIGVEDMDFDGDADLVVADRFGDVWVHRSDGSAFGLGELRAEAACHTDFGAVCTLQDMNGSNYPDLVVMGWSNSHWEPWGLADHRLRRLRLFMNDGFSFSNDPDGRFNVPCLDGSLDDAGNQVDLRPAGCVPFYHEMDCLAEDGCLFMDVDGDFEADVVEPFGHDEGTGGDGVYVSVNTNAFGNNWNDWADGNVPPLRNAGMCTPQAPEAPDSPWVDAGTLSFEKVIEDSTHGVFAVASTGDLYHFEGGMSWRLVEGDHRDYFGGESVTAVGHDGRIHAYFASQIHEGWSNFGNDVLDSSLVLSGPGGVFASVGGTGHLEHFRRVNGVPTWLPVSGRRWVYAIGGLVSDHADDGSIHQQALYAMHTAGVYSWSEHSNTWTVIAPHRGGIWAGGDRLYAQNHESGILYLYDAAHVSPSFSPIGSASDASFAASLDGDTFVRLQVNRVHLYSGSGQSWIDLQQPRNADAVFVAGNKVWVRDADNGRLRYLPLD